MRDLEFDRRHIVEGKYVSVSAGVAMEYIDRAMAAERDREKLIGALKGLVQEFYRLSRDYHRIYKGQSEEYDEHAYGKHWAFDDAAQMLEALLKEHGVTVE